MKRVPVIGCMATVVAAGSMLMLAPAALASGHPRAGATAPRTAAQALVVPAGPQVTTPGNVYVANLTVKTISQYSAGANGQLTALSPPTLSTAPLTPGELELNPSGHNLYVSLTDQTSKGGDALGQFSVGPGGALTPLDPPTVPTSGGPVEIVFTPDGKYLYVDNGTADKISEYSVGTDGALSPLVPGSVTPPGSAGELTMSPDGKFLYATGSGISQYSIGADGQLTPLVPASVGPPGFDMKISADGKFLYQAGQIAINQFSIASTGQLTPLSPPTPAAGPAGALEMETTSDGKFLYATTFDSQGQSEIAQFSVGSDGQLNALTPAAIHTGNIAFEAVVSPNDKYLFVGNFTPFGDPLHPDTISQYSIGVNGALTGLDPLTVSTGAGAGALTATPATAVAAVQIPTTIVYNGATSGLVGDVAPLSARLTDSTSGLPLAGMTLTFTFDGKETCSAITNANGVAACTVTPSEGPGTYPVVVVFAGTDTYLPSSTRAQYVLSLPLGSAPPPTSAVTLPPALLPLATPTPAAASSTPVALTDLPQTGTSNHGEIAGFAMLLLALLLLAARRRLTQATPS